MDFPKDETNHINYVAWKDRGDNIGIQCNDCNTTHWSDETPNGKVFIDPEKTQLGMKDCPNCQAIKECKVLEIETKRHKEMCVSENPHPEEICHHKPTQP